MRHALLISGLLAVVVSMPARAEFIISNAILEFNGKTNQQDIELISRSRENDYIVSEVAEIVRPGLADEHRQVIEDPAEGGLLVTPDKTVLTAGSRKLLRFVQLNEAGEKERIYRVAVKPVIKGVNNEAVVGLKVLVGYEVLVIVRPATIERQYTAQRQGKMLVVSNTGNTNILLQHSKQCTSSDVCKDAPIARVYPGETAKIALPLDAPVKFTVWDGKEVIQDQAA